MIILFQRNISSKENSRYSIDRVILEGIGPADSFGSGPYIDVRFCTPIFSTKSRKWTQIWWFINLTPPLLQSFSQRDSGVWPPCSFELQSSQPWQPNGLLDKVARPQPAHCRPVHLHLRPQVKPPSLVSTFSGLRGSTPSTAQTGNWL